MTKRLEEIFSVLTVCNVFADIGCDHGYIANAMLDYRKCDRAIIADVSEKCLKKAESLLADYISAGKAEKVVSDGFANVKSCDQALIAGMGGEEICGIIERATELPQRLVIQPMKNVDKARLCAVKAGYRVEKDYCFTDGKKYYDLIVLVKGADKLTEDETEFGRTNIKELPAAFIDRNRKTLQKLLAILADDKLGEKDKAELKLKSEKLRKYV